MMSVHTRKLHDLIASRRMYQAIGKLRAARGVLLANMPSAVGDLCRIDCHPRPAMLAEVIAFDQGVAQIMPYGKPNRLPPNADIVDLGLRFNIPCGERLLGRVINGMGHPIDGLGPLGPCEMREVRTHVPPPMSRTPISRPLVTGQRVIDGLLTLGIGQRVGLFAGSGVGKTTLLGEIAKGADAGCNVIAMVGERGREVLPFLDEVLGPQGRKNSVVIVSTSEQSPLLRIRAAEAAVTIADYFRVRGENVLFLLDSLTRLATAQREMGLLLGEPPSSRGYTPSVFQLLTSFLEQLGNSDRGTLTAILTVLVDADDMNEPIADAVRGIIDGHIVLSRKLAERGHFPAVDVAQSVSRVFPKVVSADQYNAAMKLRHISATVHETEDLVRVGAYAPGASPMVDTALRLMPALEKFLRQKPGEASPLETTRQAMAQIAGHWNFS